MGQNNIWMQSGNMELLHGIDGHLDYVNRRISTKISRRIVRFLFNILHFNTGWNILWRIKQIQISRTTIVR